MEPSAPAPSVTETAPGDAAAVRGPAILYRDDQLLAVAKPSGMMVHRGWGRAPVVLVDVVRDWIGGGTVRPVHRLDRATSGVMLFALDAATAAAMGGQFTRREVHKQYVALVRGRAPRALRIDHPIPRQKDGPRVPSATEIRRLAWVPAEPRSLSLVLARPETGRLHQIRRHLKHVDHPVIGDANYGKGKLNRAIGRRFGLRRLALHALAVRFAHPADGRPVCLQAPLPDDLRAPLLRLGFDGALLDDPAAGVIG